MRRIELSRRSGTCRLADGRSGGDPRYMRTHFRMCRLGNVDQVDLIGDAITEQRCQFLDGLGGIKALLDDLGKRHGRVSSPCRSLLVGYHRSNAHRCVHRRPPDCRSPPPTTAGGELGDPQQVQVVANRNVWSPQTPRTPSRRTPSAGWKTRRPSAGGGDRARPSDTYKRDAVPGHKSVWHRRTSRGSCAGSDEIRVFLAMREQDAIRWQSIPTIYAVSARIKRHAIEGERSLLKFREFHNRGWHRAARQCGRSMISPNLAHVGFFDELPALFRRELFERRIDDLEECRGGD